MNGEVFKCEGRTALIVQLSALCADSICDNIYSLAAVTAESDVAALGALMCNAIVKGEAAVGRHHNGDVLVAGISNAGIHFILCTGNHAGTLNHGIPNIAVVLGFGDHGISVCNKVGSCALGCIVGGIKVNKCAALYKDFSTTIFVISINAV